MKLGSAQISKQRSLLRPLLGWPLVVVLALVAPDAHAGKERIAILDVRPVEPGSAPLAEILTEVLASETAHLLPEVIVVGSSDLRALLGVEKQRQLLGCTEGSCLADIAGALGARYLLVGSVGRVVKSNRIDLKIIDTRRATALARDGVTVDEKIDPIGPVKALLRTLLDEPRLAKLQPEGRRVEPAPSMVGSSRPEQEATASEERSLVAPLCLVIGGGLATVAGSLLVVDAVSFNSRKLDLRFDDAVKASEAAGRERNLGVGAGLIGIGAVVAGALLWPSSSADAAGATSSFRLIPLADGRRAGLSLQLPTP